MNLNATLALRAHADDTPIAGTQTTLHGLPITIEHPRGTQRKLHDDKGNVVYKVHMHYAYGFFNRTKGRDGDEVDCFVGPMKNAKEVYVVHMKDMGPVPSEREDEDKCMVGFQSADAAKAAFLMHYPKSFYDGMTALPVDVFKARLAKAQLPYRKKKITAGGPGSGRHPEYGAMKSTLEKSGLRRLANTNEWEHPKTIEHVAVNPHTAEFKHDYRNYVSYGEGHAELKDSLRSMRRARTGRVSAEGDNSFGVIGDPAVGKHMDHMARTAVSDIKRLQSINPAHMPRKESAEDYQSNRESRPVRSTGHISLKELAAKAGCPKCGGKKIVLMPTDFETAKCKECNHSWQVPARLKAGGAGSGERGHTTFKVGDHVTVHSSPTLRTHGHVEGHLTKNGALTAYLVRHQHGVMQAVPARVTEYQKQPRAPRGSGLPRAATPGAKIQRFLNTKPLFSVAGRATGLVKKTFTVEAKADVMLRFEKFMAYVQYCANVGHSTEVVMSIDGDGPDAFYVKEKLPKFSEGDVRTVKVTGEQIG